MERNEVEALVRQNIRTLTPYSTARDEYQGSIGIFIDANECPYQTGYNRYPDPHQKQLKARISEVKGVEPSRIFVGNGSDEAIDVVMRVFCTPGKDNIVAIAPSYGMYAVAAGINDVAVREVMLGPEFSLPVRELLEACDSNTKLMFLCSPNNPSGNAFKASDIEFILDNFKGILVLDEAYADFSGEPSFRNKVDSYENLVVLQTLSKAWGMAALRVGLAFSSEYIIRMMSMVKYPYNVNLAAQKLAFEALAEPIDARVQEIIGQRDIVAETLPKYSFVKKVFKSDANFILVMVKDADELYNHLLADGIIVRNRNRVTGCQGCLRITIGTPQENRMLIKSLDEYEKGNIR